MEKPVIGPVDPNAAGGDAEASADEFGKGLPKRGLRKALIVVMGVAVLAGFIFASGNGPKKIAPAEAITRPEPVNVAKQLKAEAELAPVVRPGPLPPAPPPLTSAAGASATNGEVRLSAEDLKRIQREKAAASPMETNDVALTLSRNPGYPAGETPEDKAAREIAANQRATEEALQRSAPPRQAQAAAQKMSNDENFLLSARDAGIDAANTVQAPKSELALAPGTIVRLALLRGINTDSPGQITAQVVSNVYDSRTGRRLLIPMGARVIGVYSSDFAIGQRRVVMAMTRLDLPNGTRIALAGGPAADTEGYSGLASSVDNHYFSMFGSSLLVGAASLLLPKEDRATTSTLTPSGTQNSGTILANSLSSVVQTLADRSKLMKPTATIEPGTEFSLSTTRELILKEYL